MATQTVEQTTRLAPFQEEFLTDIFATTRNLFKPVEEGGQGLTMPFSPQQLAGLSPQQLQALQLASQQVGGFDQFSQEALQGLRAGQDTTRAGLGQTLLGADTQGRALQTLGRATAPEGGLGALAQARGLIGELDFQSQQPRQDVTQSVEALGQTADQIRGDVQRSQQGLRGTTAQFDPTDVARFQSPFEDQVVQQVLRDIAEQGEEQRSQLGQRAAQLGALGGAREGVERGRISENVLEAQAREAGRLRQQGFQQAQQAALSSFEAAQRRAQQAEATAGQLGITGGAQAARARAQQGQLGLGIGGLEQRGTGLALQGAQTAGRLGGTEAQLLGGLAGQQANIGAGQGRTGATIGALGAQQGQLGQGIAGLGLQGQRAGVQDINTLLGLGGLTQQQQQQEFNIARQNELARQQIPFQQLGFQSDIFRGVPALQQQATTTTTPPPSTSSQVLGLGIAGLGAAGMAGGFGNLFGGFKDGGSVRKFKDGGILNSGPEIRKAVERANQKKEISARNGAAVNVNPEDMSNQELVALVQSQIAAARGGPEAAGAGTQIPTSMDDGSTYGTTRTREAALDRLTDFLRGGGLLRPDDERGQSAIVDTLTAPEPVPVRADVDISNIPPDQRTGILSTQTGQAVANTVATGNETTPAGDAVVTQPPVNTEPTPERQGPPVPTSSDMVANMSRKYGAGDDSSVNAGTARDNVVKVTAPETGDAPKIEKTQPAAAEDKAGPDLKPADQAKNFDAANGIDPNLPRAERVKQRLAMYKDILGDEKVKDIRTDAAYATFMTGLLIAGGQSANAVENIAQGTAQGLGMFGEAKGEAQQAQAKRERDTKLAAIAGVESDIAAEEARAFQTSEREATQAATSLENAKDRALRENMQLRQIESNESIAQLGTDTQLFLANQRQKFDAEIANANNANEILAIQERGRLQVELAKMGFEFDADKLAVTLKAAKEQDLSAADLQRELAAIPKSTAQLIEKYVPADQIAALVGNQKKGDGLLKGYSRDRFIQEALMDEDRRLEAIDQQMAANPNDYLNEDGRQDAALVPEADIIRSFGAVYDLINASGRASGAGGVN